MDLPPGLRAAVDAALAGLGAGELGDSAFRLSARYRADTPASPGEMHVADAMAAAAYAAVRLPATYAATRTALAALAAARPEFAPAELLDLGSGPGTALWAAAATWSGLRRAWAVEASGAMAALGQRFWSAGDLANEAGRPGVEWRTGLIAAELALLPAAAGPRLTVLAYVLNELEGEIRPLIERAWAESAALVAVEPGTPAGWRRILEVREALLAAGAHVAAPCPHEIACPLLRTLLRRGNLDWCHFAVRVARSRVHRLAKEGELGWEDEKFIYVAAVREPSPAPRAASRVLMPPRPGSGRVWLKLCQPDGTAAERLVTRREGEIFKAARRAEWGDRLFASISPGDGR